MSEIQGIIPPGSRPIAGTENYRVDIYGTVWTRLRRLRKRRIGQWSEMTPRIHAGKGGHRYIGLCMGNGVIRQAGVHILVLETFVGPCPEGLEGCHNDGNPANNALSNVRWDTHENNCADKIAHGTQFRGEESYNAKLTGDDIPRVFELAKQGTRQLELARIFGVSAGSISAVLRRETWKHIPIDPEHLDVPLGQPAGDHSPRSKIRSEDVVEVFRLFKNGMSRKQIAKHFGLTPPNIRSILTRQTWKSVPIPADLLPSPR